MASSTQNLERLRSDPERWLRRVATVAQRLDKTQEEAETWIEAMYARGEGELADAIMHGAHYEAGHWFYPGQ
jgi:hypothetical protein